MMYSEFAEAVGCRDNAHNHEVFKNLEILYMNSDMSKQEIYEYGRKLVDNSKTEEEIKLEAQIKEEIEEYKSKIEEFKGYIKESEESAEFWRQEGDREMVKFYKNSARFYRERTKECRTKIAELKWVLG